MYSQDGYRLMTAGQLLAVLTALNTKAISLRAFRVYMAALEALARREAATRSRKPFTRRPTPRFLPSELAELVDADQTKGVAHDLRALGRLDLLRFSNDAIMVGEGSFFEAESNPGLLGGRGLARLVPVPRQILRFLARCRRPALAKTIVAYLLRGLALMKNGVLKGAGTVKVSWICKLCQISERAARIARAELIRLKWITKDTRSFQRKLNRDGAYFVIDTTWRVAGKSAPLKAEACTQSAPPIEKQETPNGSKNQKAERDHVTHRSEQPTSASGVCKTGREGEERKPDLFAVQIADLKTISRVEELYRQAVRAKWVDPSEANIRNFVCAAVRASRTGGRAGAIFVAIVRKRLWHHVTNEQEQQALTVLNRYRGRHPRAFDAEDGESELVDPVAQQRVANLVAEALGKQSRWPLSSPCSRSRKL